MSIDYEKRKKINKKIFLVFGVVFLMLGLIPMLPRDDNNKKYYDEYRNIFESFMSQKVYFSGGRVDIEKDGDSIVVTDYKDKTMPNKIQTYFIDKTNVDENGIMIRCKEGNYLHLKYVPSTTYDPNNNKWYNLNISGNEMSVMVFDMRPKVETF